MSVHRTGGEKFNFAQRSHAKPLAGVRVIDAGNMVAAPFASVLLADLGADVIKIEHPQHGDGQRKLEPIYNGIPLWWKSISRNKRCITLDLGKPAGAEIFKELVVGRDVVIENYRPGTLERWGVGYDVIKSIQPNIVMLRISGFGQYGPYRDRPGFGRVAEAMSGLTHLIGDADGPPMSPGYPLGDLISGLFGAFSVMVALYHRDAKRGTGQMIDLALYEALFRLMDFDAIQYDKTGEIHTRTGNQVAYAAPSSTYRTSDDRYITMAASNHNIWVRLCRAMEREDLIANPKFAENASRVQHSNEINGIVADWIAARPREEVVSRFNEHEVAFSVIYDIKDIFADPHYAARDALVRVADPDLVAAVVQNVVPKFSETPGSVDFLGSKLGEHNDAVYGKELNYSEHKINGLRRKGII
ncbi:MAG: CaiB/BaiF CoA transferase family protein [Pseudorhodoplanes sp.]|uniref:CaiB/BaiF CoA transferase family protein n=1 Tax=Pseudorhodoplanes sp. TaxID=1934341 RepID=UPI003D124E2E